jgi:predicted transcriptional regulator
MIGYTSGMKTAVSIPKDLYEAADRFAKARKRSRSRLYADALRDYLARHDPDAITAALNRAAEFPDPELNAWVQAHARHTLRKIEW